MITTTDQSKSAEIDAPSDQASHPDLSGGHANSVSLGGGKLELHGGVASTNQGGEKFTSGNPTIGAGKLGNEGHLEANTNDTPKADNSGAMGAGSGAVGAGVTRGVSIVGNARTIPKKLKSDATLEIRIQMGLKRAAQSKADREGTSISKVIVASLTDYVADSVGPTAVGARDARANQMYKLRLLCIANLAAIDDLSALVGTRNNGAVQDAVIHAVLAEIRTKQGEILRLLTRRSSHVAEI